MKLGIDLRFYRPEPFGLANYIAGVWAELIKLLTKDSQISKVIIFVDQTNLHKDLSQTLIGFDKLNDKFELVYTDTGYYNLQEQTQFLGLLNAHNLDLMYFFTANYPVLYRRAFIYQVFDFTHQHQAKLKNSLVYKLKSRIFLEIIKRGISKSKQVMFLGSQVQKEAENFTKFSFTDSKNLNYKPNTALQAGVNSEYLTHHQTNPDRFVITTDLAQANSDQIEKAKKFRQSLGVKKDYCMFVSVWKSHKNLTRLVTAFADFQTDNPDFQLLICGRKDPSNNIEIEQLQNHKLSKNGQILWLENLTNYEIIQLLDQAKILIQPSLSEGFGLSLIEAGSRGCPVICSNLDIFQSIMANSATYFLPVVTGSIFDSIQEVTDPNNHDKVIARQRQAYIRSQDFRWDKVSIDIYNSIKKVMQNL
jgi:glycosyltransferase involved in cell wall biosynthesis